MKNFDRVTVEQVDVVSSLLEKIAYKLGAERENLCDSDFSVVFTPSKEFDWKVSKPTYGIPTLYLSHTPAWPQFAESLNGALRQIRILKDDKRHVAVELYGGLQKNLEGMENVFPSIVAREECDITCTYNVVVKHKETGIIARREVTRMTQVSKAIHSAREEITVTLAALRHNREDDK